MSEGQSEELSEETISNNAAISEIQTDNSKDEGVPEEIYGEDIEDADKLWDMVGFHRITGGFFYSYVLLIGGAVIGLGTLPLITNFIPFPEIEGYKQMTATLLGTWFGLMDFNLGGGGGFSDGLNRFIGQYADTDPERSLKYIQFYVWFQMFSGLIQVTILSAACFTIIRNDQDLAFLTWFILGNSLVQYPGMLMVMESCLKSFQRGDKLAWLSWLQDTVFQVSINIGFLVLGKRWGQSNPAVGELMGVTLFYILSQFVDDWINLFVGGYMFHRVLKDRGLDIGVWSILFPGFDKGVAKEALTFTGKQWIGQQINGIANYFLTLYVMVNMTGFASWKGLMLIPSFLAHLTQMVGPMAGTAVPAISEAYNNDKKELCRYFIHDLMKWFAFITIFLAVSLAMMAPKILTVAVNNFEGLGNYRAGLVMIPLMMFVAATAPYRGLWSKLFVSCNRPLPPVFIGYITIPISYGMKFLFIYLTITTEVLPGWYFLVLPDFITSAVSAIIGYVWYQRKVLKIQYKKIIWQAFAAPVIAGVLYALVLLVFNNTVWPLLDLAFEPLGDWLVKSLGILTMTGEGLGQLIVAVFLLMSAIFVFPSIFFSPIYTLIGGFDDFTLEEFRKTALISGPSKFLVMTMYKITKKFAGKNKIGNKYPIADYEKVNTQIKELVEEGKANALLNL